VTLCRWRQRWRQLHVYAGASIVLKSVPVPSVHNSTPSSCPAQQSLNRQSQSRFLRRTTTPLTTAISIDTQPCPHTKRNHIRLPLHLKEDPQHIAGHLQSSEPTSPERCPFHTRQPQPLDFVPGGRGAPVPDRPLVVLEVLLLCVQYILLLCSHPREGVLADFLLVIVQRIATLFLGWTARHGQLRS
jgi:hypothetical protein